MFEARQQLDSAGDGLGGDAVFPPVATGRVRRVIGRAIGARRDEQPSEPLDARVVDREPAHDDLDMQQLEDLGVPMMQVVDRERSEPGRGGAHDFQRDRVARV